MELISYAQNREDVVLHRAFANQPTGFYVDIGANDPCLYSMTRHFYDLGWHGINVEPSKTAFQPLVKQRQRDINLNIGISNRQGMSSFYACPARSTFSTFSAEEADLLRGQGIVFEEHQVPVMTLAQLCAQYVHSPIDFMSIDVENHELEVIQGGDWQRHRPRVLVIEDSFSPAGVRNHAQWEPLLLRVDYHLALFDGLNRFYLRGEDKHLLPLLGVPANVSDHFVYHEYLNDMGRAGLAGLALARKLHALSLRYPRLATIAKWFGYRVYRGMKKVRSPLQLLGKARRSDAA